MLYRKSETKLTQFEAFMACKVFLYASIQALNRIVYHCNSRSRTEYLPLHKVTLYPLMIEIQSKCA
jgi:hypothetical protein